MTTVGDAAALCEDRQVDGGFHDHRLGQFHCHIQVSGLTGGLFKFVGGQGKAACYTDRMGGWR